MENKKGLGKGLGALISLFDEDMAEKELDNVPRGTNFKLDEKQKEKLNQILKDDQKTGALEIDVALIDNNPNQPRKQFDPTEMQELEASIQANGVIQPILLNRVGTRFMIVAGERRWRAAKSIGLKTIPAIVREYTQKQITEIALVENLMRSDLNEIEIAVGLKKLIDTHGMTQDQISRVLGKSRSSIANSLRFLNLPKEVQDLLEEKKISAGHAKILAGITNKVQCIALAQKCAAGMTVRDLENALAGKSFPTLKAPTMQSIELKHCELTLTQSLATRVHIQGNDNRGKIIVEYASKKDLERIVSKLK